MNTTPTLNYLKISIIAIILFVVSLVVYSLLIDLFMVILPFVLAGITTYTYVKSLKQ